MNVDRLRTWKLTPVGPVPAVSVVLIARGEAADIVEPIAAVVGAVCRRTADWELIVVTSGNGEAVGDCIASMGLENVRIVAAEPGDDEIRSMHRGRWACRGRFVVEANSAGEVDGAHLDELFPVTAQLAGHARQRIAVVSATAAKASASGAQAPRELQLTEGLGSLLDSARITTLATTLRGQCKLLIAAARRRVDAVVFEFSAWQGWPRRELAARMMPALLRKLGVPTLVVIGQPRLTPPRLTADDATPVSGLLARVAHRATLRADRVIVMDGELAVQLTDRYEADNVFVAAKAVDVPQLRSADRERAGILAFGRFGAEATLAPLIEAEATLRDLGFPARDLVLSPINYSSLPNHLPVVSTDTLAHAAADASVAVHWGPIAVTVEHLYTMAIADTPVVVANTPQTLDLLAATGFRAHTYCAGDGASLAAAVADLLEDDVLVAALRRANLAAANAADRVAQVRCIATHLGVLGANRDLWSDCHFPLTYLRY